MRASTLLLLCTMLSCSTGKVGQPEPVGPTNHPRFPIGVGTGHEYGKTGVDGVMGCESCHRAEADSFTQVRCDGCHRHPESLTPLLHLAVNDFGIDAGTETDVLRLAEMRGTQCYRCHPTGEPRAFSHSGINGGCASCHAESNAFAALPKPGFTHRPVDGLDCGGCHVVTSWSQVSAAPTNAADPSRTLSITGLIPTFSETTMVRVTPLAQQLPSPMNHLTGAVDAGFLGDCAACHETATAGAYFPGVFHSSLANAGQPAPARCAECHASTRPTGFVGPLATPARTPPTGAMRHDAVAWADGGAFGTTLVSPECALCHRPPDSLTEVSWATSGVTDGGAPKFHASLFRGALPQPSSCLDCHANSRPTALLTSANSALPAGLAMSHTDGVTLGDCVQCHASTAAWAGGRLHEVMAAPSSCLPCHQGERPTSTAGWTSTTYTQSPFDYVTNAQGVTHGAGEDCAGCHHNTQTWVGGHFPHGADTLAATTCIACHSTQRPTSLVSGFNHTLNGAGDCRGCHQATVRAGRYVDYFNPATGVLPGGDWKDGQTYPGDVLSTSLSQLVTVPMYFLQKNPLGLVTGMTQQSVSLANGMLHTSSIIPAQVSPGPAATPDNAKCWHCHTHNVAGVVTEFRDGKYHQALATYSATPGGAVTPLSQPTSQCKDCHEQMRPSAIVERAGSVLRAMDHSAVFKSAVTIGGQTVSRVSELDCSSCHAKPGVGWDDGRFHLSIATGEPAECVGCHYPLMSSTQADVTNGTVYAMKHQFADLAMQKCDSCHGTALAQSKTTPVAATLWRTGHFHSAVSTQPTACVSCHGNSEPATPTQSTVVYALTAGATTTNGGQWMNHAGADVAARDCVVCHSADAKASGAAWSKSTLFHAKVASPATCNGCHGLQNGLSAIVGTKNNMPNGNTPSRHVTTASPWPGVRDEISHGSLNVSNHDCDFCHTQKGASAVPGIQGQ